MNLNEKKTLYMKYFVMKMRKSYDADKIRLALLKKNKEIAGRELAEIILNAEL